MDLNGVYLLVRWGLAPLSPIVWLKSDEFVWALSCSSYLGNLLSYKLQISEDWTLPVLYTTRYVTEPLLD